MCSGLLAGVSAALYKHLLMPTPLFIYFAVRRGGKWVAKRVEDATTQDLTGIHWDRDFMSAAVAEENDEAAIIQVETNLRAGEEPLAALRLAESSSPGLDLVRRFARDAGYRVTLV